MWYKHGQVFFVVYYQPLGSHPTVTRFLKQVFESKPTAGVKAVPLDCGLFLLFLALFQASTADWIMLAHASLSTAGPWIET